MLSSLQNWFAAQWQALADGFVLNFVKGARWQYLSNGLGVTLSVAVLAALLGLVLGFLTGIVRVAHDRDGRFGFLNGVAKVYLTVIRGTPMVVQLLICYFVIFISLDSKIAVAVIAFGVNSGAYVAEIVRSGILSIDIGQTEAGRSLGLSYGQTMRLVVLPQAVRNVLPALGNEFISLLKETSVAGYIALQDLTKGGDVIRSQTYSAFMPYLAVASIYLALVMGLTWLLGRLERKLRSHA